MKQKSKLAACMIIIGLLWMSSCKDDCPMPNSELVGKWERVDGNNSPFNGMVVDFAGTNGILSIVPATATGYEISDAKWRNVLKGEKGVYLLEDRDSGGGYLKSRIFILADGKEMMLSAENATAGSYQLWKKL